MSEQELNRSEEATPHKLDQARRKGSVARGPDLAFLSSLIGLLLFMIIAGKELAQSLISVMKGNLAAISSAHDPKHASALAAADMGQVFSHIIVLGVILLIIIVTVEIIQLRGFIFTTTPLKPDWSRLNPVKGFKRLFSLMVLKQAIKSCLKFALYIALTIVVIRMAMVRVNGEVGGAQQLILLMWQDGMRLLIFFGAAAAALAFLDQLLTRREFAKQMRMSRREITKEHKDREGEPRTKQKRKQLHAEFVKQNEGLSRLPGSDMVIVNPEHFAVALGYDPAAMAAPAVRASGRNRHALALRREAIRLQIPVIVDPPLARALYRAATPGREIGPDEYRAVALHYSRLHSVRGNGAGNVDSTKTEGQ